MLILFSVTQQEEVLPRPELFRGLSASWLQAKTYADIDTISL